MPRKAQSGEVNKSAAVRDLLHENPQITVAEAVAALAKKGIDLKPNLFYFVKGKLTGRKGRRRKARQMVASVTATMGNGAMKTSDVVATILKVKHLASEVGGLKKLKSLVEALGE
jgi:hypothetical protein